MKKPVMLIICKILDRHDNHICIRRDGQLIELRLTYGDHHYHIEMTVKQWDYLMRHPIPADFDDPNYHILPLDVDASDA